MPLQDLIALLAVVIVGGSLLKPIARALADRMGGSHAPADELQAFRNEVLAELQETRRELAELTERMDFAERLLARPRDADHPSARP